jgi:hypothetical protein
MPTVKVIASLRNPAERAFSGFLMRTRRGGPVRSVQEELTSNASHVHEGFYYARMKRYFDVFPPEQIKVYLFDDFKRDSTSIMKDVFEFVGVDRDVDLDTTAKHNPANVPKSRLLNRAFYHPNVIRTTKSVLPERAYGLAKRVRQLNLRPPPTLSSELRAELIRIYRDDIVRLEELLGRDLSVWLEPQ